MLRDSIFTREAAGMEAELQRVEVERPVPHDDDLAVEHAAAGSCAWSGSISSG